MEGREVTKTGANILILILVFAMPIFGAGVFTGDWLRHNQATKEAVKAGHGQWVADKDGNVQFKWKDVK